MPTTIIDAAGRRVEPADNYRLDSDLIEHNIISAVLTDDNYTFDSNPLCDIIKDDLSLNHYVVSSPPLERINSAALIANNADTFNGNFPLETVTMSTLNTPDVRSDDATPEWPLSAAFDELHCSPEHDSLIQCADDDTFHFDDNQISWESSNNVNLSDTNCDFLLPIAEVDEILQQLEAPSPIEYTIADVQPMTELHGDSTHVKHDHDYCLSDEPSILNEFLEVSSELSADSPTMTLLAELDSPVDAQNKKARRRELNNEACKRSRQRRKMTLHEKIAERRSLETRNDALRNRIRGLEKMRDEWKRRLLDMVAA